MSNGNAAGQSTPPAPSDLQLALDEALDAAILAATTADCMVHSARSQSFRVFKIFLDRLRADPHSMAKIDPVLEKLEAVSVYPRASCAHIGAVQFADRVFLAVRGAIPPLAQVRHAARDGVSLLTWFPSDRVIERHFARVSRRIGRKRWPNVDRLMAECRRERAKVLIGRTAPRTPTIAVRVDGCAAIVAAWIEVVRMDQETHEARWQKIKRDNYRYHGPIEIGSSGVRPYAPLALLQEFAINPKAWMERRGLIER